jgi:hypothetical protein
MFDVARALARMAGATRLTCAGANSREIACLAARDAQGHVHLIVANLSSSTRTARLDLLNVPSGRLNALTIDEQLARSTYTMQSGEPFTLRPFACLIATTATHETASRP